MGRQKKAVEQSCLAVVSVKPASVGRNFEVHCKYVVIPSTLRLLQHNETIPSCSSHHCDGSVTARALTMLNFE